MLNVFRIINTYQRPVTLNVPCKDRTSVCFSLIYKFTNIKCSQYDFVVSCVNRNNNYKWCFIHIMIHVRNLINTYFSNNCLCLTCIGRTVSMKLSRAFAFFVRLWFFFRRANNWDNESTETKHSITDVLNSSTTTRISTLFYGFPETKKPFLCNL